MYGHVLFSFGRGLTCRLPRAPATCWCATAVPAHAFCSRRALLRPWRKASAGHVGCWVAHLRRQLLPAGP